MFYELFWQYHVRKTPQRAPLLDAEFSPQTQWKQADNVQKEIEVTFLAPSSKGLKRKKLVCNMLEKSD